MGAAPSARGTKRLVAGAVVDVAQQARRVSVRSVHVGHVLVAV
jgi:hypothetical protein